MKNFLKKHLKKILLILGILILGISSYLLLKKDLTITINEPLDEIINVNSDYIDKGASFYYGGILKKELISNNIQALNKIDTSKIGEQEIIYEINYNNIIKRKIKHINVIDSESPIITVEGIENDSILACPNTSNSDNKLKYTAIDNYDGDITNRVIKSVNENDITLEVSDTSNNKTIETINIENKDLEKPNISLKGNSTVYVLINTSYKEPGYTATDNCDGDITNKVKITKNINTSKTGTYKIKYNISDSSNNTNEITRTVKVYQKNQINTTTPDGKTIYLTFDDGPCAYTEELLNTLSYYNVKATFFVVNKSSKYDKYITRAYNEGHTIGIHSWTHDYKTIYSSIDGYFNDFDKIRNKIKNLTGAEPQLLRFPGGSSNTVSRKYMKGIMSSLAIEVESRGYRYFDWNISSEDASGKSLTSNQIANIVINRLGNNRTYVVLQHDIKPNSVKAVKQIIEYGLSNGYNFAPLTMESPTIHSNINN